MSERGFAQPPADNHQQNRTLHISFWIDFVWVAKSENSRNITEFILIQDKGIIFMDNMQIV